jgi:hypothetical protein
MQQDTTDASMALPVGVVKGDGGRPRYEIRSDGTSGQPHCVYNTQSGRKVACHADRGEAAKQMKALSSLAQDTTSADINADTAHFGKSGVRALGKSGEENFDEQDYRLRRLMEKALATQPYAPTPIVPSTKVQAPHGNTAPRSDTQRATTQAAYPDMPGLGGPRHDEFRAQLGRTTPRRGQRAMPPSPMAAEQMSTGSINDLPDSAFAYIEPGGAKDSSGRTTPRSKRHFPIHDKAHVRNALARASQSPFGSKAMPKIKAAAKRMGIGVAQENFPTLAPLLALEGTVPKPVILQEASDANGRKMRLRVPFYIGESVSRAPGFQDKIYFPTGLLPSIVQEGKQQISEGAQRLTVYARHAHATSGDRLPVGDVVDLEQEGRIGYATLEIVETQDGKDLMALLSQQPPKVNAVSLRSGPGRFELERKKVNGEPMLQAARMAIDGIDFAPDSPAMKTYGVEVLAAEARVDLISPTRRTKPHMSDIELTLESLRADWPELVTELEAPLRKELNKITLERDVLLRERNERNKAAKLEEIASQFPDPSKALPILQEMCAECETDAQVAEKAFPVLLEALARSRTDGQPRQAVKPTREQLLDLFKPGGAGRPMIQEQAPGSEIDPALVGGDFAEV